MDLKIDLTNISNYYDYAKEICLQNLLLTSKIRDNLLQQGDIFGVEKIDNEVIPIYEKIYLSLDLENLKYLCKEEEKEFDKIKDNLEKILKDSSLKKEFIMEQLKKRKMLSGKSGAEVVKRFYTYKLKEYKKIRTNLLEKINTILDEEEELNLDLSNAIQEEDQMIIIEKLQPIREKYRNIERQINIYQKEIEKCEKVLLQKWEYEIYGTLEEKDLLNSFSNIYSNISI